MLKKILILVIALVNFYTCTTVGKNNETSDVNSNKKPPQEKSEDINKLRKSLSDNIIALSDPRYMDMAGFVLDLIRNKNWIAFSELTDRELYNSYVVENNGSVIDYSMFILHTGEKGISTNYSLDEIETAFYTDNYIIDNKCYFEGIYLYPSGESEFFKVILEKTDLGLVITME